MSSAEVITNSILSTFQQDIEQITEFFLISKTTLLELKAPQTSMTTLHTKKEQLLCGRLIKIIDVLCILVEVDFSRSVLEQQLKILSKLFHTLSEFVKIVMLKIFSIFSF